MYHRDIFSKVSIHFTQNNKCHCNVESSNDSSPELRTAIIAAVEFASALCSSCSVLFSFPPRKQLKIVTCIIQISFLKSQFTLCKEPLRCRTLTKTSRESRTAIIVIVKFAVPWVHSSLPRKQLKSIVLISFGYRLFPKVLIHFTQKQSATAMLNPQMTAARVNGSNNRHR